MKKIKNSLGDFWKFLKQDTWQAWFVSLVLAFLIIKFMFFPFLSFGLNTDLPLVVVESCSMFHSSGFDSWWESNGKWYSSQKGISKEEFLEFGFKNGLNKGDIILVSGRGNYEQGDIIIFDSQKYRFPLIHRVVNEEPYATKGDNGRTNPVQLDVEKNISEENIIGKSVLRIPGLGWVKLIFFEGTRPKEQRGFCK